LGTSLGLAARKACLKLISLLFALLFILHTQDRLPIAHFVTMLQKASSYNRIKTDHFLVIYDDDEERAVEISKQLLCAAEYYEKVNPVEDYTYIIFIGMDSDDIIETKKKFPKVVSVSDDFDNIDVVSLVFHFNDKKRLQIASNKKIVVKEAKFQSNFLNITARY